MDIIKSKLQNQTYQTKQTKLTLTNQTNQTKLTKTNIPSPSYQSKDTNDWFNLIIGTISITHRYMIKAWPLEACPRLGTAQPQLVFDKIDQLWVILCLNGDSNGPENWFFWSCHGWTLGWWIMTIRNYSIVIDDPSQKEKENQHLVSVHHQTDY